MSRRIKIGDRVMIRNDRQSYVPIMALVLAIRVVKLHPEAKPVDVLVKVRTNSGSEFEVPIQRLRRLPSASEQAISSAIDAVLGDDIW